MALFFSGAVTSSPVKQRHPLADESYESLGSSLLSPDVSYVCYSTNPVTGSPCCCRRSPRLLTNGYYVMTEDSYSWDDEGNVSLTPSKTNVSYKENLVRIFRRRRRARRSLANLLSDMTETCQSWLDEKIFRGVFNSPLTERSEVDESFTQLNDSCSFTYDHTEISHPADKEPPPSELLMQEEICTETCYSQEQFTQSFGGFSEVPPPPAFNTNNCCPPAPLDQSGTPAMKGIFLFIFTVFIFTTVYTRCLFSGLMAAMAVFAVIVGHMCVTKSGPMARWRTAKTEDITSRNE